MLFFAAMQKKKVVLHSSVVGGKPITIWRREFLSNFISNTECNTWTFSEIIHDSNLLREPQTSSPIVERGEWNRALIVW